MNKLKIGLVTLGLVVACGASAALVSYISNAPTATVEVSSPVEMSICEGDSACTTNNDPLTLLASFGGSDFTFTTTATNKANKPIGGYYVMVIDAGQGDVVTGKEFTSIDYTINETEWTGEDGDLIDLGKLCVVRGNGSLTKLAEIPTWTNEKMILFYDYDSIDSAADGNLPACSPLVINDAGNPLETRSFTHLNAAGDNMSTRSRTFTPTWNTGVMGNFTISSQYVIDLATYANDVYNN